MADTDLDTNLDPDLNNVGLMSFLDEDASSSEAEFVVPMAAGIYVFEVVEVKPAPRALTDYKTKEKIARPAVNFGLKIADVISLKPNKDNPDDPSVFVGRRMTETHVQLGDMDQKTFLNRLAGLVSEITGKAQSGPWGDVFANMTGAMFKAEITLQEDRNQKGVFYPRMKRGRKGDIVPA
jgi:hypothetical protein